MPKLVRLYIQQVLIGFSIAVAFVVLLLLLNVGNLQHLIFNTSGGWIGLGMLIFFNGIVFGGVQFAIAVMRMADSDDGPSGGKRLLPAAAAALNRLAVPVRVDEDRSGRR